MDDLKEWIYPSTRIGDAIKYRPQSLDTLYRGSLNPWQEQDMTLDEFCRREGFSLPDLLAELTNLPVPDAKSDWDSLPIYYLIDFLTEEHRLFINADIQAIRTRMDMPLEDREKDPDIFARLTDSLREVTDRLRVHQQEEEDVIFPVILRNEWHLLNPGGEDFIEWVSGHSRAAWKLERREDEFGRSVRSWLDGTLASRDRYQRLENLEPAISLITTLGLRLEAHDRLEQEVLRPRAERMERELAGLATARG
jgi:iron-sulfur cluster repair protein YtfE (RIC family)